jgi:glycosyltransferase involved in cell wall biosynthesis
VHSLIFTSTRPWAQTGGARRIQATAEALAKLGEVDLVVFRYDGAPPLHEDPPVGPFSRVLPLDDARSVENNRAQLISELPIWLRNEVYDLIWFDRENMWMTARELVCGRIVVDVDDLEDIVLERWVLLEKDASGSPLSPGRRVEMKAEILAARATHIAAAEAADIVIFSSEKDLRRFDFPNSAVVQNTYKPESSCLLNDAEDWRRNGPCILFQGYLEWPPNEDAAIWFVSEIFPIVRAHVQDASIVLVGKASPRVEALNDVEGVEVVGEVPAMTPFLASADVMVAPLRVGGGTRIKILEAFASGIPVVSTSIGCEGLDVEAGVHLDIADDAQKFATSVIGLLQDPGLRGFRSQIARKLYQQLYTPEAANEAVRRVVLRVAPS